MIRSIKQLAEALTAAGTRVSDTAVRKWTSDDRWTFGAGPWKSTDVKRIQAWRAEHLQENRQEAAGTSNPKGSATTTNLKNQKLFREIKILDQTLLDKQQRVHDVEACRAEQVERNHKLKMALITYLPSESVRAIEERVRLVGRPLMTLELQDVIRNKVEEALRALSGEL